MMIAFYKGQRTGFKGAFDRLVRWWTAGPYSHCEIVLAINENGTYQCASASKQDGGVRIKQMPLPSDRWDVISVHSGMTPVDRWFADRVGQPYDMLGLFGFIGPRGTQNKRRWFCSEACAAAMGFPDPWRYDPNTLFATLTAFGRIFISGASDE